MLQYDKEITGLQAHIDIAGIPERASEFVRTVKQRHAFRVGHGSGQTRAGKPHTHRTETDAWDEGAVLA